MRLLSLVVCAVLCAGAAEAKQYSAERFDVHVRMTDDGAVHVTETIVFRFEEGTFTHVFREIPTRRTDGVEILGAEMDGRTFPPGTRAGEAEIARKQRLRVTWRFDPVSNASHAFTLRYVLRGLVRQEDGFDRIHWRALPGQHAYTIDASTVQVELPAPLAADPDVRTHRVAAVDVTTSGTQVVISAQAIRRNGWVEASLRFPRGSAASAPPLWQQREERQRALAPRWIAAAAALVFAGLVLFFGIRQGYDSPARDASVATAGPGVPDTLPAPVAGALVANGGPNLTHAMATLFLLAERGELRISERPRGALGQRSFAIARTPTGRPLSRSEEAALATIFGKKGDPEVTLATARGRLTRGLKKYSLALKDEMRDAGLIDADRQRVRQVYLTIAIDLLVVGGIAFIPSGLLLVRRFGPWVLLVPAAIVVSGLIGLIFHASLTPLSNDGLRRERYWSGFRRYLKDVAADRAAAPPDAASLLPFAVALGQASAWSKYLKHHPGNVPRWFHAVSGAEAAPAFVTFVAAGAATGHGGGAGAGGAAGGGASGAG